MHLGRALLLGLWVFPFSGPLNTSGPCELAPVLGTAGLWRCYRDAGVPRLFSLTLLGPQEPLPQEWAQHPLLAAPAELGLPRPHPAHLLPPAGSGQFKPRQATPLLWAHVLLIGTVASREPGAGMF